MNSQIDFGPSLPESEVVDALPETGLGRHVAGQRVRSGTSAPPNYDEARVGESRADFAPKVNIALKEFVETRRWLKFSALAGLVSVSRIEAAKSKPRPGILTMTNDHFSIFNESSARLAPGGSDWPNGLRLTPRYGHNSSPNRAVLA